jgi:hypothetical protein
MAIFKRAAARGIAHELARSGVVSFPTKQAMDDVADQAADSLPSMPELPAAGPEAPPAEADTAALVSKIIELVEQLKAAQGVGGAGAPPMPGAMDVQKQAAAADLDTVAAESALALMDKAAAETGSLAGQGKSTNTLAESTKNDSVAALDEKHRPQGTHHEGAGNTKLDTAAGQVGASKAPTVAPNASPSGENSVSAGTKSAEELRASLLKQANTLIGVGGQKGNSMEQAAKTDPVAALDLKNRPLGKYMVEPGGANFKNDAAARVGVEKKVDQKPNQSPAGTNSVIEASKAASEEESAYLLLFQKTAAAVKEHLPSELSDDEKVAAVSAMIGLNTDGRQAYINALAEKVAAAKKQSKNEETPVGGTSVLAGVRAALKT